MAGRNGRLRIAIAVAAAVLLALLALRGRSSRAPRPDGPAPTRASPSAALLPDAPLRGPAPPAPVPPPSPALPDDARARLEGRVVSSETGAGVAGAELSFSRGSTAASVRAAGDGSFRFEPPTDGRWLLAAVTASGFLPFAPEWEHSPVAFEARAGQALSGVEIRLAPATPLVATVLDPEGRPAPGAEVRVLGAAREAVLFSLADRFTTDAGGQVRLAAPRGAVVEARKAGFAPGHAVVDLVARTERRVTVRLGTVGAPGAPDAPPERIAGRVVERGGGALAVALVVAERELGAGAVSPPVAQTTTAADGAFALGPLDRGAYRLTAAAHGRARAVARGVAAGSEAVTLALGPGTRLRGCVRDATSGAPVTAFTVLVSERRAQLVRRPALARSFLASSGCWSVEELSPGAAAVVISAPGWAPSAEIAVEIPESGEATADATVTRAGRLSGVVVDAATKAPLPGARVALEGALLEAASVFPVLAETVADDQGRFALAGLPPRFSLAVAAEEHHVRVVSGLEAPPGREPAPIVVALSPVLPGEEPGREFTGIGVTVGPQGDGLVVTSVLWGGGAAEAGLARGDLILAVDGVPVTTLGLGGAIDAIRGAEGTSVLLRVRREPSSFEVRVGRRIVRG